MSNFKIHHGNYKSPRYFVRHHNSHNLIRPYNTPNTVRIIPINRPTLSSLSSDVSFNIAVTTDSSNNIYVLSQLVDGSYNILSYNTTTQVTGDIDLTFQCDASLNNTTRFSVSDDGTTFLIIPNSLGYDMSQNLYVYDTDSNVYSLPVISIASSVLIPSSTVADFQVIVGPDSSQEINSWTPSGTTPLYSYGGLPTAGYPFSVSASQDASTILVNSENYVTGEAYANTYINGVTHYVSIGDISGNCYGSAMSSDGTYMYMYTVESTEIGSTYSSIVYSNNAGTNWKSNLLTGGAQFLFSGNPPNIYCSSDGYLVTYYNNVENYIQYLTNMNSTPTFIIYPIVDASQNPVVYSSCSYGVNTVVDASGNTQYYVTGLDADQNIVQANITNGNLYVFSYSDGDGNYTEINNLM